MNKKGFTLAELLGVIVVIGLLLLLIIPLIINGTKNRENEVEEIQNNIIYEAVSEYMDSDKDKYPSIPGSIYCITIKELKEAGKLTDEVKNIIKDEEYADDYTIEVKITKDGTRKYSISEGECKPYKSEKIEFLIEPSNSKWSKTKTVTIFYPESQGECGTTATCTYKKDNGETQTVTSGNSIQVKFDKNGTIYANMEGKSEIEKTQKVEKIDIENPIIIKIKEGYWNDNAQAQISITMKDNHSGVTGYCILTEQEFKEHGNKKPQADDTCFRTLRLPSYGGTGTATEYLSPGEKGTTYYFFVKDRVGNVSDNIGGDGSDKTWWRVEDNNPPTCTITTSGPKKNTSDWFTGDVKVNINVKDDHSGVFQYDLTKSNTPSYGRYCGKTANDCGPNSKQAKDWNYSINHNYDTTGQPYYGYVKDRAHNINKCTLSTPVKRDTVLPTCSTSKSNLGTTEGVTVGIGCDDRSPSNTTSPVSGVAYCTPTQYGVKASSTYSVTDAAGNVGYCSVSVTATQQWYRQTCGQYAYCKSSACGAATCTSECCGVNKTCTMWCCSQVSGPDDCKPYYTQNTVCDGAMWCRSYSTSQKTCTSASCCGYASCRSRSCGCASWNNYGWVNDYCSSVDCRSTDSRYLYS